jgi:hypothetical protein
VKVLYPGHQYKLDHLDGEGKTLLQFVQRLPHHEPKEGVQCQEVLRALIDRVEVLNLERYWKGNKDLLHHLRMALALFEVRALMRHVEKDELHPEKIVTGNDGHFKLEAKL